MDLCQLRYQSVRDQHVEAEFNKIVHVATMRSARRSPRPLDPLLFENYSKAIAALTLSAKLRATYLHGRRQTQSAREVETRSPLHSRSTPPSQSSARTLIELKEYKELIEKYKPSSSIERKNS